MKTKKNRKQVALGGDDFRADGPGYTPRAVAAWARQRRDSLIETFPAALKHDGFKTYLDLAYTLVLRSHWPYKLPHDQSEKQEAKQQAISEAFLNRVLPAAAHQKTFKSYYHFVNWLRKVAVSQVRRRKRYNAALEDALDSPRWAVALNDPQKAEELERITWFSDRATLLSPPNEYPKKTQLRLTRDIFFCPWDGHRGAGMPEFQRARNPGYVPPEFREPRKPSAPAPLPVHSNAMSTFGERKPCRSCGVAIPRGTEVCLIEESFQNVRTRATKVMGRDSAPVLPLKFDTDNTTVYQQAKKKFVELSETVLPGEVSYLKGRQKYAGLRDGVPASVLADPSNYGSVPLNTSKAKLIEVTYWMDKETEQRLSESLDLAPRPSARRFDDDRDDPPFALPAKTYHADDLNNVFLREEPTRSDRKRAEAALHRIAPIQAKVEADFNRVFEQFMALFSGPNTWTPRKELERQRFGQSKRAKRKLPLDIVRIDPKTRRRWRQLVVTPAPGTPEAKAMREMREASRRFNQGREAIDNVRQRIDGGKNRFRLSNQEVTANQGELG